MTNVLKTHPMERIELDYSEKFISGEKFSEFIASLPQTGSQLKSLVLPATFEVNIESLEYIFKSQGRWHARVPNVPLEYDCLPQGR